MTEVLTCHIVLDDRGRPWIEGTNVKVIEVVLDKIAYGWSPEQIHQQHPHLSLGKIHAALSYYYDHQAEMDAQIERHTREAQALRAASKQPSREQLERRLGSDNPERP